MMKKSLHSALIRALIVSIIIGFSLLVIWLVYEKSSTEARQANTLLFSLCLLTSALLVTATGYFARRVMRTNLPADENSNQHEEENELNKREITGYLRSRYGPFWRWKVRLLLIVGDDSARETLLPGLQEKRWLEGNNTVLINGGSLHTPLDNETLNALRDLRRRRPLDGIVYILNPGEDLTPSRQDNALGMLENIALALRWQAPVWLWQLCASDWSQQGREELPVGALFSARMMPEQVKQRLDSLVPQLRAQGLAQMGQKPEYDFMLRLGHQLEDGGSLQWQQQLSGWLNAHQKNTPLRGLMFSLPSASPVSTQHEHALTLSASWHGITDNCKKMRGRRVMLPWQQMLVWSLRMALLLWGVGMLISFAVNRQLIIAAAHQVSALAAHPETSDKQLIALHDLRNTVGSLQHNALDGSPWLQRAGLDHNLQLLAALLPEYAVANNRLIRDPAHAALEAKLKQLTALPPSSPLREKLAKTGYDQLRALLMMMRPDKVDSAFFASIMMKVQPQRAQISAGLWQSLAPDLWAFYANSLPAQPGWKIIPDAALVDQTRQLLLAQVGQRNNESTLYENLLKSLRHNYADLTLADMTNGTDAHSLFSSKHVVPGMFTHQAWEGGVKQAIGKAANARREEIDWVLSDNRRTPEEISPEVLEAHLTQRYFSDFAGSWLNFLNGLRLKRADTVSDVTGQLALISDVRQSPLIALMNTLAWQGQTGQKSAALGESIVSSAKALMNGESRPLINQHAAGPQGPLDTTFGPLLALLSNNRAQVMSADDTLNLQSWLTRITRVRLHFQQMASAPDPQEKMQALAQRVFQGKSVDLTDTHQYGSLLAASLGEEWNGFGNTVFVQPLDQAWETVLQPSATSLNEQWKRAIVDNWRSDFDGRYPFAAGSSDASLPTLAAYIRRDSGRIERFLSTKLGGVLHREGSQWVADDLNGQGLNINPAFIRAINQLGKLADILFIDGTQGIRFELQARPAPEVIDTLLTLDGQQLHYFNQMAEWQAFRWPGDSDKPGTRLIWTGIKSGGRLFGDYNGNWGFIRWLEQGKQQRIERSRWRLSFTTTDKKTLEWVLRTQLENGPLALLKLRGFTLPEEIFKVEAPPQK